MSATVVRPLSSDRLADYLDFFDHRAFTDNPRWAGCYCYFPYHDPKSSPPWQQRPAADNRQAACACIEGGQAQGYLAYDADRVVGWCNAAPKLNYPALRYLNEPDAADHGCIFCFVIAPTHRRQGIARTLLDAACAGFAAQRLRLAEALPSRKADGAAENYHGPLEMYLAAGFSSVRELADGRVLVRKRLD